MFQNCFVHGVAHTILFFEISSIWSGSYLKTSKWKQKSSLSLSLSLHLNNSWNFKITFQHYEGSLTPQVLLLHHYETRKHNSPIGFQTIHTSLLTKQEACHNRKGVHSREGKNFLTLAHFMTLFSPCLVATHQHLAILPLQCLMIPPTHRSLFKVRVL